jgi:CheY-like chemotaxis protein
MPRARWGRGNFLPEEIGQVSWCAKAAHDPAQSADAADRRFGVLEYLRGHEDFRSIPAVMFTTVTDSRDRTHALALGAKEFLVKDH